MSALIPMGLGAILLILGIFGVLSYEYYSLGNTWPGLACFALIFLVFAGFVRAFRKFFQRNTGRMVFALWMVSILGAYFAYLIHVPVEKPDGKGGKFVEYENKYPMGNDLAGGTELIYILNYDQIDRNIAATQALITDRQAKLDEAKRQGSSTAELEKALSDARNQLEGLKKGKETAPDKAAEVVRHRVDPNGTKGIPVTTFGNSRERLRIQLPRASQEEVERIKTAINTQGRLAFHIVVDPQKHRDIADAVKASPNHIATVGGVEYQEMTIKTPKKINKNEFNEEKIIVERIPKMEGSHIAVAVARTNPQDGRWEIQVTFDAQGSTEFALLTGAHIKDRMAIVLDGEAKSAPTIQTEISTNCQITGNFDKDEAEKLAAVLTAGSLPAEVKLESEYYVGPSLGAEQIQSGVLATVIATVVVILFMLVYYRLSGAIAALCMLLNLPMLLGMMGFFKATLTLPGIAGIVLTLGMAVDANVLIIERLREEIARGRSLKQAVSHGFERAFLTIIDCHMTTLISSVVLYYLGTGPVRGFAVSLSLGILTTLFCNLWLNWNITEWLVNREAIAKLNLMQFFKETHIDFMGSRRIWMTLTGGAATISLVLFIYYTTTNKDIFDVDFTGGTLVQFNLAKGHTKTDAEVKTDVKTKVKKALDENVQNLIDTLTGIDNDVEGHLAGTLKGTAPDPDFVVAKTDKAAEARLTAKRNDQTAKLLQAKLPQYGETLAKEAGGKANGLLGVVDELEKQLKKIKEGDELTAQSFGKPETLDKYRSFTVTTRIVNNLVTGELNNALRKVYAGELEPEAVEAREGAIALRLENKTLSKEDVNNKVEGALAKLADDPAYTDIAGDLKSLKVASIDASGDYLEALLKGPGGTSLDPARLPRLKQAVALASISDKIGGPISRTNAFGAQVAGETGIMSLLALMVANLAVFVYLWFRFEFSGAWGFGAIVALIHDVVIAAGAVIVGYKLGFPILINLNIVAALLTITGFSVNDTIVVFDRIREVKAAHPTRSYEEIVNEACNATLSRTILTSLTVIMSVLSLLIFGGPTIKDMAYTLLIGFIVGTYSSIFIASPLMIWWYKSFGSGRAPIPSMPRKGDMSSAQGAQI